MRRKSTPHSYVRLPVETGAARDRMKRVLELCEYLLLVSRHTREQRYRKQAALSTKRTGVTICSSLEIVGAVLCGFHW